MGLESESRSQLEPSKDLITRAVVLRTLVVGFALVILLLIAAGLYALHKIHSIQRNVNALEELQTETDRLIDELEDEQATLNAVFYRMSGVSETNERGDTLKQLERTDEWIKRITVEFPRAAGDPLWRELRDASVALAVEAKRLLASPHEGNLLSPDLLRKHNRVAGLVAQLSGASRKKAFEAQVQIRTLSRDFLRSMSLLLGSSVLLALFFAVFTIRTTTNLFRNMQEQTSELARVSWNLLQKQENTARRFSHELHDELGQSLAALKAELANLSEDAHPGTERLDAIGELLDEAIGNVRELSQLLRPTILDDFGLDASLRWLSENFARHTGLEVCYQSAFDGRLLEDTETHLFRIAQEALTNVARHSGATRVQISLLAAGDRVSLSVKDDGKGLSASNADGRQGLGLVGMRARARAMGGKLDLLHPSGGGLQVNVRVPLEKRTPA